MYISHIELERRERDRELMRSAARERLVNEAIAGRKDGAGRVSAQAHPGAWLLARGLSLASVLVALVSPVASPKGH